jgi:PAS domain S-box-containing protein
MKREEKNKSSKKPTANPRNTDSAQDTYRTIFDNMNDAILLRDLETIRIVHLNNKLCEMTGYTAREIMGMPRGWFSTSLVQNGKTVADHYAEAARGKPQLFERQGRKKDGTLFWVESNLRKVTIGGRAYLLSVLRDITRRRQEQEELRQSQEQYRSIVEDQAEFLVCHFLTDGTVTFVNEALCRCLGVRREELLGKAFWPFVVKEDIERLKTYLSEASPDNPVQRTIEHRVVTRDGRVRCLVWSGKALFDGQEISEFQAIGRDITLRKEAEEALKESEKTLRALFDAITEPVLLLDVHRRVLALNQTVATSIGKEPQEIIGTCIDDYFNPDLMARRKKYTDGVVRSGKPARFDSERAGKHFEHCAYPVFNDQGQVTRLAVFARDVTVQKEAQKELEAKSRYLEEMNTTLKVLLNRRGLDKKELEDTVLSNVRKLILPVLHRLKDCRLDDKAHAFLDVLETNVKEVISPFLRGLDTYQFTPRELEIISLVREGRTTKEIARLLSVCRGAVDIYRHHIRKKLGITTVKTNLRSHLLSLAPQ